MVNACVRVLSETFASAPLMLYRKTGNGREPATDHMLHDVLHNVPNSMMSPYGFYETLMVNLCAGGNSVCERQYNRRGELVGLFPYPHDAVKIKLEDGQLVYEIGGKRTLKREQVLHIPNMSFNGLIGLSPITYAAETIRLGLSYEKYGVNFYDNAAMPSGVLEHPNGISDLAFGRLKEDLKKNYTGLKNSGAPMLLEEGMKWHQVTINPVDAQLLESKNFQIEDICRIFRVPQHLVSKLDRSTNNNIEHQSLEFVMYTMLPHFKRAENAINSQLLTPEERRAGYYVEFKIDGLMRGDQKSRAEAYMMGRQNGYYSINDIRKLENMPAIDGGDSYMQPLNYINILLADEYYGNKGCESKQ